MNWQRFSLKTLAKTPHQTTKIASTTLAHQLTAQLFRKLQNAPTKQLIKAILARVQDDSTPIKDLRELLELLDSEFLASQKTRFEVEGLRDLRSLMQGDGDASQLATLYLGKR